MKYKDDKTNYKPDMNDDYFTINDEGEIYCFEFTWCTFDEVNMINGNCFKNKDDAEKHKVKVDESFKEAQDGM